MSAAVLRLWEGNKGNMENTAIKTSHLTKVFPGGIRAVSDLDLTVRQGEVFGFLGPNGAGKTTTVRLLNGTLEPTAGQIKIFDRESQNDDTRMQTATLAEDAHMYEHMSGWENLMFFARLYEISRAEAGQRVESLLKRMGLWNRRDGKVGAYSTGMRKRTQLARALIHRPRILFLDEPTSGLDPEGALEVTNLIRQLAEQEATTVFLCTHNLFLAEGICSTFGFLRAGELVACGNREQLISANLEELRVEIRTLTGVHDFTYENDEQINGLIDRVQAGGEKVVEVRRLRPSLEDVYFSYVGRRQHEPG